MWEAAIEGFLFTIGLICAMGPLNIFCMRQGIKGVHVLTVALTAIGSDVILMSLGSLGLGSFLATAVVIRRIVVAFGAGFILFHAIKSIIHGIKGHNRFEVGESVKTSRLAIAGAVLGFAFLNPQSYTDIVLTIGSASSQFDMGIGRVGFTLGCIGAAVVWFFFLCFGAKLARKMFAKQKVARVLDFVIAGIMSLAAYTLIAHEFL